MWYFGAGLMCPVSSQKLDREQDRTRDLENFWKHFLQAAKQTENAAAAAAGGEMVRCACNNGEWMGNNCSTCGKRMGQSCDPAVDKEYQGHLTEYETVDPCAVPSYDDYEYDDYDETYYDDDETYYDDDDDDDKPLKWTLNNCAGCFGCGTGWCCCWAQANDDGKSMMVFGLVCCGVGVITR